MGEAGRIHRREYLHRDVEILKCNSVSSHQFRVAGEHLDQVVEEIGHASQVRRPL